MEALIKTLNDYPVIIGAVGFLASYIGKKTLDYVIFHMSDYYRKLSARRSVKIYARDRLLLNVDNPTEMLAHERFRCIFMLLVVIGLAIPASSAQILISTNQKFRESIIALTLSYSASFLVSAANIFAYNLMLRYFRIQKRFMFAESERDLLVKKLTACDLTNIAAAIPFVGADDEFDWLYEAGRLGDPIASNLIR